MKVIDNIIDDLGKSPFDMACLIRWTMIQVTCREVADKVPENETFASVSCFTSMGCITCSKQIIKN